MCGHHRRGGGGHYPLGQSYRYGEQGTQPAGCWPKNAITAAAANPEILPLEFLLGDDPVHGSLTRFRRTFHWFRLLALLFSLFAMQPGLYAGRMSVSSFS